MLIAIFLIVIGNGCRTRGKIGQNNVGSVISKTQTDNLSKRDSPKNKNNLSENNLTASVDNQNWWPSEIPIPSGAISTQNIAPPKTTNPQPEQTKTDLIAKNNHKPANKPNTNQETHEIIIPPRPLASFLIEPKPLSESNNQINQVNNFTPENKNINPVNHESNNSNNSDKIKTVAENKSAQNEQNVADENMEMSLNDLEAILLQAKWQRNIQLEHWNDNGIKSHINKHENQYRERREQIKQLNLSDKDKLKKKNDQIYVDELISTWRWYNSEIDELVKKQLDPVAESRPVFPVDPKEFLENDFYKNAKYNILRANAAILMGRCNDYDSVDTLIEIIKNERLDEIRCAAIETLGKMELVGFEKLIPLLELAQKRNNVTKNTLNNNRNNNNSDNDNNPKTDSSQNQITTINRVIWSELLTAIANKIKTWEHPCFLDPLAADNVEVRRTSAKLWRMQSQQFQTKKHNNINYRNNKDQNYNQDQTTQLQRLPKRFLEFVRSENDLAVRVEMIKTLGIWREPEILGIVANDLNHRNSGVRFAAMEAVAVADCKAAERILKEKLRDVSAPTRAKSIEALCKLGFVDDVLRLADDADREVRLEVAKAIAFAPNPQTAKLAKQYIENDHETIKLAALNAIVEWKQIDLSGEILIESLQNRSAKVRTLSTEILSRYFPDTTELLSKNQTAGDERSKIIAKIKNQFNEYLESTDHDSTEKITSNNNSKRNIKNNENNRYKFNNSDIDEVLELVQQLNSSGLTLIQREAIKRHLSSYGEKLPDIFEYLYENYEDFELPDLVEELLAESDDIFGLLSSLGSESELLRRKSVSELLRRSKVDPLNGLVCSRILEHGLRETDEPILTMSIGILRNSDAYKARYLAASVLQAGRLGSVELRRVACETFGEVGNGYDIIIVAQNLGDQRRDISRAAFTAMVKMLGKLKDNEFENERENAAAELWSKLPNCDLISQVEISAVIYLLGDESGAKSFIRYSFSPETRVRSYVANVIGILEDADFLSVLIRYLDDKDTNVCQTALTILPQIVGEDIGIIETKIPMEHELSRTQKKIARWKKWQTEADKDDRFR
ncbi:MAG: HEAT repeat domain-containing protein [Planctomycetaceae bacterium]|nr:HEAT repeat domain-containing protein [Planctomycetaceae bacterium]